MVKIILLLAALLFFVLGLIGLILPVIPQVPFFALGTLLLCAVSKRFKRLITGTKLYQQHLKKHIDAHEKLREFMEK